LAENLLGKNNQEQLQKLLALHEKRHKDDPWLLFYRGELHLQNGAYEKADQAFAAAMGKPLDLQQEERFRSRRVFARYKGGKGLSAYNDIPPRKKTFDQLAWLYSGDRNAKGLLTLIEAHRRVEPKDQDLPAWDLEARWLAEEYEKVVKLA